MHLDFYRVARSYVLAFIVCAFLVLGVRAYTQEKAPELSALETATLSIAKLEDLLANAQLAAAACQGQLKAVTDATLQAQSTARYVAWIKACEDAHAGYACSADGTLTKKAATKD